MLQKLHIQNYAIIDEIEIDFSGRLNIITGETGAGKSILMGALGLILGDRAETNTLMNKEKKCVVEGHFITRNNKQVRQFLKVNQLDPDEELVVRREIAVSGKSRTFINDTPVNLSQVKELSSMLVDLHQQFDTLELGDHDFQRMVLDALAGNLDLVQQFSDQHAAYVSARRKLEVLTEQQQTANAALDYNQYLFDELEEAGFKSHELEELEAENKLLSNAENIKQQLSAIYFQLKDSELPIVQQLKSLRNKLQALESYQVSIADLSQRLASAHAEIQDIADELESIDEGVQYSPERIQFINEKITLGYRLFKKHGVKTTEELLAIKDSLQVRLNDILHLGDAITQQGVLVEELHGVCLKQASAISTNRIKAAKPFVEKVNSLLAQVGMPNAKLKVQIERQDLSANGTDLIVFLFDANKTERFEPLAKVASGGELSRIMLCIKSLVAKKLQLPTLIFDEIDTGISGEAAKQVGIIMQELAQAHQLISITHQPQIAARADAHYFVYKSIRDNRVTTSIRVLTNDERITTIAQMLSGEKPTAAALENAREMVGN